MKIYFLYFLIKPIPQLAISTALSMESDSAKHLNIGSVPEGLIMTQPSSFRILTPSVVSSSKSVVVLISSAIFKDFQ